jgi:hypothetical protein
MNKITYGLVLGGILGVFAHKVHSLALGVLFGLGVGPLFAFLIAQLQGSITSQLCCRVAWSA